MHKNHNFTYSPILLPRQKKPIHWTWLSKNPTKINSFWNQTFHTSFWCICDNSTPRLHKNLNFTYSAILLPRQKNPIRRTWLSQNPGKINSFCNQTFHTSFLMHLWQFPKRLHKNHNFTYSSIFLPRPKNPIRGTWPVSYTHLTLPTNREV